MDKILSKKIFLAGAERNILSFLKKTKLTPTEKENIFLKAKKEIRRFVHSVCLSEKGEKFFLKARIMKRREVLKQLKHEISVYKSLNKVSKNQKLNFLFPSILKSGKFRNIDWYLRNYREGKLAGEMMKDFGFRKNFLKNFPPKKMAEALISLQKIPAEILGLKLYKHGGWWYLQDFNYYKQTSLKFFLASPFNQNLLTKKEIKFAENILRNNKNFLDEKASFLTHGDLYPNNILLTPDREIVLLDWELMHLNNPSFDICFVWLLSKNDKKWQKDFFNLTVKNKGEEFEKLFRISLISLSIRFADAYWQGLKKRRHQGYPLSSLVKSPVFSYLKFSIKIFKSALFEPKKIYDE